MQSSKQSHQQNFVGSEKEITCQNCGGNTMFSGSLTAEKCPYCATPIQRDDVHDAPERLPVDGVLPFSIDDKQAKELIEKWIRSAGLHPASSRPTAAPERSQSVYTAYFTYDADTRRATRAVAATTTPSQSALARIDAPRHAPVGAGPAARSTTASTTSRSSPTTGFERNRIAKLEPWPTETAKPYSAEYAAGHLRRTYDHDVEECLPEATSQMEAAITHTVRQDIGGDQQDINSMNISWLKMTYKHLLLPIWLLTVIYEQKPFQVYINGVTGEVHGARPYSKVKILTAVMLAALVIVIIVIAVSASGDG